MCLNVKIRKSKKQWTVNPKSIQLINLNIFNLKGQLVKTLVNEHLDAAYHSVVWNGKDNSNKTVSSGIYFYKMETGSYTSTKKMILMK